MKNIFYLFIFLISHPVFCQIEMVYNVNQEDLPNGSN